MHQRVESVDLKTELERAIRMRDECKVEDFGALMGWADACVEIAIIEEMLAALTEKGAD